MVNIDVGLGIVFALILVVVCVIFLAIMVIGENSLNRHAIAELKDDIATLQDAQEAHIKRCGWWEADDAVSNTD